MVSTRRRQWHPTPVLLPRKSHGWRSVVGYSPWGCKELDTTERIHSLSSLGISNFLEEISSLSHSIVFLFFALSLRKAFLSLLFSLPLASLLSQLFVRPPQTATLPFLHFFPWGLFWPLSPVVSQTSIQSSSGTLSIRSNPLNLFVTFSNCKGFDLGHTWMV